MTFYIIRESFGMIDFFDRIRDYKTRDESIRVLDDLVNKKRWLN